MERVKEMLNVKIRRAKKLVQDLAVTDIQGIILQRMLKKGVTFGDLSKLTGWGDEIIAEFFDADTDLEIRDVANVFTELGLQLKVSA
jgi:cyanate lyase